MNNTAIIKKSEQIIAEVNVADSFFKRLFGLLPSNELGSDSGLLIIPCKQVHTVHMKYAIDVIFLSKQNAVVHIEHDMKPNKMTKYYKEAKSVLEISSGVAKQKEIEIGDTLTIER